MEHAYLIVVEIEGKKYIQLAEKDGQHLLSAFETKQEAIDTFDGFREKAHSSNYESYISGSMGILNLRPHVIGVDKSNPESIKPYLVTGTPMRLEGKVFGAFVNVVGVEVTKDILELSVCDVAHDIIHNR
jgi:hypothetical protein